MLNVADDNDALGGLDLSSHHGGGGGGGGAEEDGEGSGEEDGSEGSRSSGRWVVSLRLFDSWAPFIQAREQLALWRLQRNVSLVVGAMLVCSAAGFAAIDAILFPRVHTHLRRIADLAQLRSHTVDGATGVY